MKTILSRTAISLLIGFSTITAQAADQPVDHSAMHAAHNSAPLPTEVGQSAFAALAEIVQMLNDDPDTDWSKVDIDRLRSHLVDMNEVTTKATSSQSTADGIVIFKVSGTGRTLQAIKAMVPAHSAELGKMDEWQVEAEIFADHVNMVVLADDVKILTKVQALGFFGMMSIGAHHQPHHWAMATGGMLGH